MEFLLIDHKKNPKKIAELDKRFAEVEGALKDVEREMKRAGDVSALHEPLLALSEIWVEKAWCYGEELTLREAMEQHEKDVVPEDIQARMNGMRAAAAAASELDAANEFNAALRWPTAQQTKFVEVLNRGGM